jgi:2,4-diketo-3-deoxy-L-fuconate hydrolase
MSYRMATMESRAVLLTDAGVYDLERHSGGAFSSDTMEALARTADLHKVADGLGAEPDAPLDLARLDACVPSPRKVFAVGLNYRAHAEESGMEIPPAPLVFAKFPNCICGPAADIIVYGPTTDWEAELVVVMGTHARDIPAAEAWKHIAGLTVGQDISERMTQFASKPPHFDLGKSYDTFGPIGPAIVSADQLADPENLAISCDLNGERRQDARTDDLIFTIPELVAYISGICTLEPGDVIFTGTPSGVGAMTKTFLAPGDLLETTIEGLGTMRNRCVARPA